MKVLCGHLGVVDRSILPAAAGVTTTVKQQQQQYAARRRRGSGGRWLFLLLELCSSGVWGADTPVVAVAVATVLAGRFVERDAASVVYMVLVHLALFFFFFSLRA